MHKLIYLAIAAMLVFSQVAFAMHDVQHESHDQTELCQVFANSDHAKGISNKSACAYGVSFQKLVFTELDYQSISRTILLLGSRGPPSFNSIIA